MRDMAKRYQRSPSMWLICISLLMLFGITLKDVFTVNTVIVIVMAIICLGMVAGLFIWAWKGHQRDRRRKQLAQLSADNVDSLHYLTFEKDYVPAILQKNGYHNIRTTPATDHGIDVIASSKGVKYGIQIKHTRSPYQKKFDNKAVQEAVAGIKYHKYRCDRPMVVTNGYFSKRAYELAKDCGCTLIDRDALADMIVKSK